MTTPHRCIGRTYLLGTQPVPVRTWAEHKSEFPDAHRELFGEAPTTNIYEFEKRFHNRETSHWYPSTLGPHILGLVHYADILLCEGMDVLHPAQPFPSGESMTAIRWRDVDVLMFKRVDDALVWKARNPGQGVGTGRWVWLLSEGAVV